MKKLLIKINEIPDTSLDQDREFSRDDLTEILAGDMPTPFQVRDGVRLRTHLRRAGLDVVFRAEGTLPLLADCSACLQSFELDVPLAFSMTLQPQPAPVGEMPEEMELSAADVNEVFYSGDTIDLGELLREQIILALPMFPRCSDECKGLCPGCGRNLNHEACQCESRVVDPRFAVLKDLKARQ